MERAAIIGEEENSVPITFEYEESKHLLLNSIDWYGSKVRELGRGAYGFVSEFKIPDNKEAVDVSGDGTKSGRKVAIKFGAEETIAEIAYLMRVRHPNVLNIIDGGWDRDEEKFFCVLPVAKNTLSGVLKDDAYKSDPLLKLDIQTRFRFTFELMSGVSYCLQRDIIHRDLKPQNILIMQDGTLKIADLGSTTALECVATDAMNKNVYTVWYRPPEILMGGTYDSTADIWAMGCIVYEIFKTVQTMAYDDSGPLSNLVLFPRSSDQEMTSLIIDALGPISTAVWPEAENLPGWQGKSYTMLSKKWSVKESGSEPGDYYYFTTRGETQFERPMFVDIISFPLHQRIDKMPPAIQDIISQCVAYPPRRARVHDLTHFINQAGEEIGMIPRRSTLVPTCEQALDMRCKDWVYKSPGIRRQFSHEVKRTLHLANHIVSTEGLSLDDEIDAAINIATFFCEERYDVELYIVECSDEVRSALLEEMGYDLVITLPYDYLVLFSKYYTKNSKGIAMKVLTKILLNLHVIRGGAKDIAVACLMIACTFTEEKFKHATKINQETMRIQDVILTLFSTDEKPLDKTMVTGIGLVESLRGKALLT